MLACVYLHRCVLSTLAAHTGTKATHTLQPGAHVGQKGAQRPLLLGPGTALHLLQADAAQRVTATEVKVTSALVEAGGWLPASRCEGQLVVQDT